jgi:aspartyl-tRNA(Asn)/glutamyl-tRNA(Gln) amidotransferase subunit B
MRSSAEAGAYLRTLKEILEYTGVSDVNMEEGSLRVDANVSARPRGEAKLGTKTEVKNMNSFSGVERALEAEFARQCGVLDAGGHVEHQTMLWDGARGEVRPARTKEQSHDYRYFPEPDLPPLILDRDRIEEWRRALPELPAARRERFTGEYALTAYDVEVLTTSSALADYYESVARSAGDPKAAANWVINDVLAAVRSSGVTLRDFRVRPADLGALIGMVRDGIVSGSAARTIFGVMVATGDTPAQVAEREGLTQVGDDAALRGWIDEAFAEHPAEAARYRAGERKLQGVLVGAVMRKSKGRADPKRVNQLLAERIGT